MNDAVDRVSLSSPIGEYLERLLRKHGAIREGAVAR